MMLQIELSDSIAKQAHAFAEQKQTTLDALIASSLLVTMGQAGGRPSIAERAARGRSPEGRAAADAIWAGVPDVPPDPGDELPGA